MIDETRPDDEQPTDQLPGANRPRWIHPRDVTRLIKRALKAAFPNQRFSVRYRPFGYTTVEWVDGPERIVVADIAQKFDGAEFDGDTDSWRYRPSDYQGELVQFGIHRVYCDRLTARQVHKPARRRQARKAGQK